MAYPGHQAWKGAALYASWIQHFLIKCGDVKMLEIFCTIHRLEWLKTASWSLTSVADELACRGIVYKQQPILIESNLSKARHTFVAHYKTDFGNLTVGPFQAALVSVDICQIKS